MELSRCFYIGSCRYQGMFPRHFPPRLHSTREILHFLRNATNLHPFESSSTLDYMFGGARHPLVKPEYDAYAANPDRLKGVECVVVEISTRKVVYDGETPLSQFYTARWWEERLSAEEKARFSPVTLNDDDILRDILTIQETIRTLFGVTQLAIVPHVDLKARGKNGSPSGFIEARHELRLFLQETCKRVGNVWFINVGRAFGRKAWLESVAPDGLHLLPRATARAYAYIESELSRRWPARGISARSSRDANARQA